MAESDKKHDSYDAEIREFFMLAAEKCAGKQLAMKEKCTCKSNAVKKMLTETFNDKKMMTTVDASIYSKFADRTTKKLTVDDFIGKVLPAIAEDKVGKSEEKKDAELLKMKCAMAEKLKEWKSPGKAKDAAVVGRLTDSKSYTGAHKQRFGDDGKGKGMEGRCDKADDSGYVGGYKGKGSYDQKH